MAGGGQNVVQPSRSHHPSEDVCALLAQELNTAMCPSCVGEIERSAGDLGAQTSAMQFGQCGDGWQWSDAAELRTALAPAYAASPLTEPSYTAVGAGTVIGATHITELRAAVEALESASPE